MRGDGATTHQTKSPISHEAIVPSMHQCSHQLNL